MHICYIIIVGKVLWSDFFEIHVFSRDHKPAHFHVYFPKKSNSKGNVKIEIETLDVVDLDNVSQKDLNKLSDFLTEERINLILAEWERFHESN